MSLFDDIYRTDYEQFFRYMKGENLEDPKSISYWRKYQNFASRRPNRNIKALETVMYPKCMKRGYEIYHTDAFYPKDKRRFKEKNELDYFCRKEILDTCKKVFATAPPKIIKSAVSTNFSTKPTLISVLAPPIIATNGLLGLFVTFASILTSVCTEKPKVEGIFSGKPTVVASGRCEGKAS